MREGKTVSAAFFYRSGIGIGRGAIEAETLNGSSRKLCKDFSLYEYRLDPFNVSASIAKTPADVDARPIKESGTDCLKKWFFDLEFECAEGTYWGAQRATQYTQGMQGERPLWVVGWE